MKMIASARLRNAEKKVALTAPFNITANKILEETKPEKADTKKAIYMPICSDRGLCGGINSQMIRQTKAIVRDKVKEGISAVVIPIGDKAVGPLQR